MLKTSSVKASWKLPVSIFTLGTLDCITTSIGVNYYNLGELNPLMTSLLGHSIYSFILVKMITTLCIAILAYTAQSLLLSINKKDRYLDLAYLIYDVAFSALIFILILAVINNSIQLLLRW